MNNSRIVIGRRPRNDGESFLDANTRPSEIRSAVYGVVEREREVVLCTFAPQALDLWREAMSGRCDREAMYATMFVASGRGIDEPITRYGAPAWLDNFELGDIYQKGNVGSIDDEQRSGGELAIHRPEHDNELLRYFSEGRSKPPTEEEERIHEAAGGLWRWVAYADDVPILGLSHDGMPWCDLDPFNGGPLRRGVIYDVRYWALNARRCIVRWPVVEVSAARESHDQPARHGEGG